MSFDTSIPNELKHIQQWFGKVVAQPIDEYSRIYPFAPSGVSIVEEAAQFIAPSPTLEPHQRIQIYNQQYWWRFFSTLQDCFPILVRLLGYKDFNFKIVIPYIIKYPSDHWNLGLLGRRLPLWIEEEYFAENRQLILDSADIDLGYNLCFINSSFPSLSEEDLSQGDDLFSQKLFLQPSLQLYLLEYHLFKFRDEVVLQEPEYWFQNDLPPLEKDKNYQFILFRNRHNQVLYEELSKAEFELLNQFRDGNTLESAIDWLSDQSEDYYVEAESNLQLWMKKWIFNQWLTPEKHIKDQHL